MHFSPYNNNVQWMVKAMAMVEDSHFIPHAITMFRVQKRNP